MEREIFNELVEWLKPAVRKPLVIWGVPGCGKKTALSQFGGQHFRRVFDINFADTPAFREIFSGKFDPNRILDEIELYFGGEIDLAKDLILLSEVQLCQGYEEVLLSFARLRSSLAVCGVADNVSEKLKGFSREIAILQMYPLNFKEFLAAVDDSKSMRVYQSIISDKRSVEWSHHHLLEQFKKYLIVGGMPQVVSKYKEGGTFNDVRKEQEKMASELLLRIESTHGEANGQHMKSIIKNLLLQLGQNREGVTKFNFKGVLPGSSARFSRIEKPLKWLERHGYLYITNIQSSLNRSCEINKSFKLYFFDIGILSYLLQINPEALFQKENFKGINVLLENHVAMALLSQGESLFCWRGTNAEVSFVRNLDGLLIPNDVRDHENLRAKNLKAFVDCYHPDFVIKTTDKPLSINRKKREVNLPYYLAEFEW